MTPSTIEGLLNHILSPTEFTPSATVTKRVMQRLPSVRSMDELHALAKVSKVASTDNGLSIPPTPKASFDTGRWTSPSPSIDGAGSADGHRSRQGSDGMMVKLCGICAQQVKLHTTPKSAARARATTAHARRSPLYATTAHTLATVGCDRWVGRTSRSSWRSTSPSAARSAASARCSTTSRAAWAARASRSAGAEPHAVAAYADTAAPRAGPATSEQTIRSLYC